MGRWSSGESVLAVVFTVILSFLVYLDLFVLNKKAHKIPLKESVYWSLFWFSLAISFGILIYVVNQSPEDPTLGKTKALEFITGYFLEYSLSVDNLFVFIMIFQKFRITPQYQPLILKWGIIGALFFRAVMIFIGAGLVFSFIGFSICSEFFFCTPRSKCSLIAKKRIFIRNLLLWSDLQRGFFR